jgi:hypothetical protein
MSDSHRIYESERGFPLLYVYQPGPNPVLTLENYTKWYEGIYLVMPDGSVQKVGVDTIDEVQNKHRDALWVDHLYHPRLLYRVARHLNADIDERAVEVAIGRWMLESGNCHREVETLKFEDPDL